MTTGTIVSIVYALTNIGASYGLNARLRIGPWLGCVGAFLGFTTGLLTDAHGLLLNTPVYLFFGWRAIRSGSWDHEPWLRRKQDD